MAILLNVKWIERLNEGEPHRRIIAVGGDSGSLLWKHTQTEAIRSIESGVFSYYVELNARPVPLEIASASDGTKYLTPRGGHLPTLFNLPQFPFLERPGE